MSISGKKGVLAAAGALGGGANYGEASYTSPGSYSFTVPAGVEEVSAVVVGGGSNGGIHGSGFGGNGGNLAWRNGISVTSGGVYSITVGSGGTATDAPGSTSEITGMNLSAVGGYFGNPTQTNPAPVGAGGGRGGNPQAGSGPHGGGGAGGYTGNGGNCGQNGSGGGGAGGYGNSGANGGGVGIFGQGSSGTVSNDGSDATPGGGGSGGQAGQPTVGGLYGGGGGGQSNVDCDGANGAVRIIWGGAAGERQFPTTNVGA